MWLKRSRPAPDQGRDVAEMFPQSEWRTAAQPLEAEGWQGRLMGRWKMMWSLLLSQQAPQILKHHISLPPPPPWWLLFNDNGQFGIGRTPPGLSYPPLRDAQCLPPRFCISTAGPSIKRMVCLCLEGTGDLPSPMKSPCSCCFILGWRKTQQRDAVLRCEFRQTNDQHTKG